VSVIGCHHHGIIYTPIGVFNSPKFSGHPLQGQMVTPRILIVVDPLMGWRRLRAHLSTLVVEDNFSAIFLGISNCSRIFHSAGL